MDGEPCNSLERKDSWEEFRSSKYHVDVFYGDKRVILIIRLEEKDKQIIRDIIDRHCEFLKPSKKE